MKEREISLLELLTETMLHWRAIFIWMIAGAVLAGAFSCIQSYRALKASDTAGPGQTAGQSEAQQKAGLEDQLTEEQLQNVNYVIDYEAVYKQKSAYQENSILMRIDPNCVQRADLTFYVSADSWRRTVGIEKAYEDMIQGGELAGYVAGKIHAEDAGSVRDVLSLARGAGSLPEGTDTFRISIIHFDREMMRDMAEAVIEFFKNKQDSIEKVMGSHKIMAANQSEAAVTDMELLEKQKKALDDIASMKTVILQHKDAFTAEEQQYYDFMTKADESGDADGAEEKLQEPAGDSQAAFPGISRRYLVLGMFLAAFLYVFVFFVRFVFNNKLHSTDSMQELYGIPQLGMIPQQQEHGRMFGFADEWILSLRDSGRRRFTRDEALQLAAAAVRMAAVKEGMGRICLAGCGLSGQAVETCEAVRDCLEGEGIHVEILNNILYDAQAMGRLEETDGAVLVGQAQSTLYSEIAREKELFVRQGITVLGGIVAA